jgi:protein tyrosine phosphatase (PTP) superfamily phosphohydrolase (DUF442 family)
MYGNLNEDLCKLKEKDIKIIVCLMSYNELKIHNLAHYSSFAQQNGFIFYHIPITQSNNINKSLLKSMYNFLYSKNVNIYIHSWKSKRAQHLIEYLQNNNIKYKKFSSSFYSIK